MAITDNTTLLNSLLEKANALSDAGEGGGSNIETCIFTYDTGDGNPLNHLIYTTIVDGVVQTVHLTGVSETKSFDVVVGSYIYIAHGNAVTHSVSGEATLITSFLDDTSYDDLYALYVISGDCTVTGASVWVAV